jgi:hypothetical protein
VGAAARWAELTVGAAIERITLARLPQRRFKVRIEALQDSGSMLISQRTYKGCRKSGPRTRRGGGRPT